MKKNGGKITIQYRDLTNGDEYQLHANDSLAAASTIKLPLALYVMELAAANKINLNQKLTYKSHHYYGGSGVIQYDKVGTTYTIRQLIQKAMIYSDNIAFIMLKEKVGKANFNRFLKKAGGQYAYPNGQNITSAKDLTIYASRLYQFSQNNPLGRELIGYLEQTIYNTTIPSGIKGVEIAHKVGMIPMNYIYNDVGIVYDEKPFIVTIMVNKLSYEKSQKVISDIASIIYKHHKAKHLNTASYNATKQGETLLALLASFNKAIDSGSMENIDDQYDALTKQVRTTEESIGKVYGNDNRIMLGEKFIKPAKIAVERTIYEVSQLRLLKKIELHIHENSLENVELQFKKMNRLKRRANEIKAIGNYSPLPDSIDEFLRNHEAQLQGEYVLLIN